MNKASKFIAEIQIQLAVYQKAFGIPATHIAVSSKDWEEVSTYFFPHDIVLPLTAFGVVIVRSEDINKGTMLPITQL